MKQHLEIHQMSDTSNQLVVLYRQVINLYLPESLWSSLSPYYYNQNLMQAGPIAKTSQIACPMDPFGVVATKVTTHQGPRPTRMPKGQLHSPFWCNLGAK
ncbi:hypothetical protein AAC387_Pa04g2338 [Persea americana]